MSDMGKLFKELLCKNDHTNHRYIVRHKEFGTGVISGNYMFVREILNSPEVLDYQPYFVVDWRDRGYD